MNAAPDRSHGGMADLLAAAHKYIDLLTSTSVGHRVDIYEARRDAKKRYDDLRALSEGAAKP